MKNILGFAAKAVLSGFLIIIPLYLAALLLLKAVSSLARVMKPVTELVPDWVPAADLLSVLIVLLVCFLIGVAVRTALGRALRERLEKSLFQRIPGYAVLRSLTQQLAGESGEKAWKPALAEIEEALVPAFIIEEFADGRFTVFVPSSPTPLAGALYILERKRVHLLDVPFTRALQVVSRWGAGAEGLAMAMHNRPAELRDEHSRGAGSADAA